MSSVSRRRNSHRHHYRVVRIFALEKHVIYVINMSNSFLSSFFHSLWLTIYHINALSTHPRVPNISARSIKKQVPITLVPQFYRLWRHRIAVWSESISLCWGKRRVVRVWRRERGPTAAGSPLRRWRPRLQPQEASAAVSGPTGPETLAGPATRDAASAVRLRLAASVRLRPAAAPARLRPPSAADAPRVTPAAALRFASVPINTSRHNCPLDLACQIAKLGAGAKRIKSSRHESSALF